MSTVDMQGLMAQMRTLATQAAGKPTNVAPAQGGSFGEALRNSIENINGMQQAADGQARAFQAGAPGVALYDVVIDTQKASMALQMGIQVRNRLVDSYRQVMNMQV